MKQNKLLILSVILLITLFLLAGCESGPTSSEPTLVTLNDDFSNPNSGWYTGADTTYSSKGYVDGTYEITGYIVDKILRSTAPVSNLGAEYTVEVDVEHLLMEGNSGLVFNIYEASDFYEYFIFRLEPYAGKFMISKYNSTSGWTDFTDWEYCYPNQNTPNKLKVDVVSDKATFYLNGQALGQLNGLTSYKSQVGVGVFTSTSGGSTEADLTTLLDPITARFDNFKVKGYAVQ